MFLRIKTQGFKIMLSALEGTEKQIKWATAIRKEMTETWKRSDPQAFMTLGIEKETKASWWIANRQHHLIGGVLRLHNVKPKESSGSAASSFSSDKVIYEMCADGRSRYTGELRDLVTGKVVVDLDCPF